MSEKRELKNRIRISTTFEIEIYERLQEYSKKTSIPISRILDKAAIMYLESVEK